jgi:hypothetical protein
MQYTCGDTAVAAHGLKGTQPQAFFEARAGLAPAGGFQYGLANAKAPSLEAEQVDATDGEIAAQILGLNR